MTAFDFEPSPYVPFRDRDVIARCRAIKRQDMDKHPNPDFRIQIVPDEQVRRIMQDRLFSVLAEAAEAGRSCALLLPNPWPDYRLLARRINEAKVSCKKAWFFAMDEYADQDGRIAPEDWPRGFVNALLTFFWNEIDPDLRPPREQVLGPSNENIDHYFDLMQDAGGLDASFTGPGWTGHVAFCEPDAPEFGADRNVSLDEWKQMGTRICTLSPFTLAQNSLHGSMGFSGDLSAVPPKAATVGPREVISARYRMETAAITIRGTTSSWQRLTARLCYHGPVSPKLPASIHQELRTDCLISESIAADIHDSWDVGY